MRSGWPPHVSPYTSPWKQVRCCWEIGMRLSVVSSDMMMNLFESVLSLYCMRMISSKLGGTFSFYPLNGRCLFARSAAWPCPFGGGGGGRRARERGAMKDEPPNGQTLVFYVLRTYTSDCNYWFNYLFVVTSRAHFTRCVHCVWLIEGWAGRQGLRVDTHLSLVCPWSHRGVYFLISKA